MSRKVLLGVFVSLLYGLGCMGYSAEEITAYCQRNPSRCLPYLGGQYSSGGATSTGGVIATGGSVSFDAAPPHVISCPALAGYSISGDGCVGPYVTNASATLTAGMYVKEESSTQVYVMAIASSAPGSQLVKVKITPDKLLSWSAYGCNPDCMAISPPSPNGCATVTQIVDGALEWIDESFTPVNYRAGSVVMVYSGADVVMTSSTTGSWTVHNGDMFVSFPFNLISTTWRKLSLVPSESIAEAIFPNVTSLVKRTITSTDLTIFGKSKWDDVTTINYQPASVCASDSGANFNFSHLYPSPAP